MDATMHPAAARYMKELERELVDLPRPRRREVLSDIREHIEQATAEADSEAEVRTILDDLGDPESISAEARERFGITRRKAGLLEASAIALLLVGGIVLPVVGWIIGVVMLWVSRVWTQREKLIGTLVVPGGLALPAYLIFFSLETSVCVTRGGGNLGGEISPVTTCSQQPLEGGIWGLLLLGVLVIAPLATAIYLGRRAWRTSGE